MQKDLNNSGNSLSSLFSAIVFSGCKLSEVQRKEQGFS